MPTTNTADNADGCDSNPSAYRALKSATTMASTRTCGRRCERRWCRRLRPDLDGYTVDEDCDDVKPDDSLSVYYDGIDNDCNLLAGDGDKDGDGYWSVDYMKRPP